MAASKRLYEDMAWRIGREASPYVTTGDVPNVPNAVMAALKADNPRFDRQRFLDRITEWREAFTHSYNHRDPSHRKTCKVCQKVDNHNG